MKLPQQTKPVPRQLSLTSSLPTLQGSEIHMSSCACTLVGGVWRPTQNNCPGGTVPHCDARSGGCQCVPPMTKQLLDQLAHFQRISEMEGVG
jgi:hypothetical protein